MTTTVFTGMTMTEDVSMTRARQWAQSFLAHDTDGMKALGENFEYYLNHVDELESGELEYTDLPELTDIQKLVSHVCVMFGTTWGASRATLHVVTGVDRKLVGVYGVEENAVRRAKQSPDLFTEAVGFADVPLDEELEELLNSTTLTPVGENLQFLVANFDAIADGEMSPTEAPNFGEGMSGLITYSAMFGLLWEYSHPSINTVLGDGLRLIDVYHERKAAEEKATEDDEYVVQRVNVQDGDLPPEVVVDDVIDSAGQ